MNAAAVTAQLDILKKQLKGISNELKEVSEEMIQGGFTEIPIFVAHQ